LLKLKSDILVIQNHHIHIDIVIDFDLVLDI